MAKGAIAAGVRLLLKTWCSAENIEVFLAGAFGNYINQSSAQRIGLLRFPKESVRAAGNTALSGAKLALFNLPHVDPTYRHILQKVTHVPPNEDPGFQDAYTEEMAFQ